MSKEKLLSLHKKYAQKNFCSLKETATQAVFGFGNHQASIVFIGEAPGKSEDLSGRKLIVTLGLYALNHFIPDVKIGEAHGQSYARDIPGLGKQTFFALYHPAAALYNGGMRETLLKDFKKIRKLLV